MVKLKFPSYRIELRDDIQINDEDDGRFIKYWVNKTQLGRCLFKSAFPFSSSPVRVRMDWREKVACELGKLIGLPVARTELAILSLETAKVLQGSISVDYNFQGREVISLRSFLSKVDPNYDNAYSEDYIDGYNVQNAIEQLRTHRVGLPPDWQQIEGTQDAADVLVGYLMFDCWLSATDRHDENIEIAIDANGYYLCPSFDHGDCLGTKLSPQQLQIRDFDSPRLTESCWWEEEEISTTRAFEIGANLAPMAANAWKRQLVGKAFRNENRITTEEIEDIFGRIPNELIDPAEADFAIRQRRGFANELLKYNLQQIMFS